MASFEDLLARSSLPLFSNEDLDPLLEAIGDAKYVLLGEASHGTSQYYTWRARLSQRLIEEKGFTFVAVEGDWPDCYRVNKFVTTADESTSAHEVLRAYNRWPTWMWANWEMVAFIDWLHRRNCKEPAERRSGFYGLDVYSLFESMDEVLVHLRNSHPDLVEEAERAFACFQPYEREGQAYAWATTMGQRCEDEVMRVLRGLRASGDAANDEPDDHFSAEMNARAAVNAERYYRAMVKGDNDSWNVRDTHMMDTLDLLMEHHGPSSKAIVWEHNTHIGDATATDMADAGMVNIGQLCRERHPGATFICGFGSYQGSVIAGMRWGAPMEKMPVPEAREGSWEELLHRAVGEDRLFIWGDTPADDPLHNTWRGHRAIGVVYHPERERYGNYVPTLLTKRYDTFMYIEESHALHPLHIRSEAGKEPPETYPFAV